MKKEDKSSPSASNNSFNILALHSMKVDTTCQSLSAIDNKQEDDGGDHEVALFYHHDKQQRTNDEEQQQEYEVFYGHDHEHHFLQNQNNDVTGNWAFHDGNQLFKEAPSSNTICNGDFPYESHSNVQDSDDMQLHCFMTEAQPMMEQNRDKTLHYLIQDDEIELVQSFYQKHYDEKCLDVGEADCSSVKECSEMSFLESSPKCQFSFQEDHMEFDEIQHELNLEQISISHAEPLNANKNQLFGLNLSSIGDTTDSSIERISGGGAFYEHGRICYMNIGHELVQHLRGMHVKERRPLMAMVVDHITKQDMEILLGQSISSYEWSHAKKHRKYPGPGKPILQIQKFFRKRVNEAIISEFIEWLHASDMLQSLSYGHKIVKYCNGYHVPVEAVKRNKNKVTIMRQYIHFWNEGREASSHQELVDMCDEDEADANVDLRNEYDDICSQVCKKTSAPCLKEQGHHGRHSFTPKGMVSPSTIEKLLDQLTSGQIKSLVGLDNTFVESGYENFEGMKAWVKKLRDAGGVGELFISEVNDLLHNITRVAEFHKLGFPRHLGQDGSNHICTCFQCGFYSKEDSIRCAIHEKKQHVGPCQECLDSFQIFEDMFLFHDKVATYLATKCLYENNPLLKDDMSSWYDEIYEHLRHMLKFRAHVAQREDESIFDKEFYCQLSHTEVLVIFDYKMKILASMFREKQIDWFSKRGFSCLGCLILFGSSSSDETNDVEYHFFISDDTTQDANAVNIVKECDGAGCFAAAEAKGMIARWKEITTVPEASYKTMVPGCGKTSLDGMFGILGQHISRLVDQGESFVSAEELWELLAQHPLKFSYFHLIKPQRDKSHYISENDPEVKKLKLKSSYYLITCNDDGEVRGFCHSRHGSGIRLYALEEIATSMDSKTNLKARVNPLIHVLKSSHPIINMPAETPNHAKFHIRSQHTKTNTRETKVKKDKKRVESINERLKQSWKKQIMQLEEQGIYRCRGEDEESKRMCLKEYISSALRQRHETRCLNLEEKHFFPQENMISGVLKDARSGKWALCLACGALPNRDSAVAEKYKIKPSEKTPSFKYIDAEKYYSQGSYQRGNLHFKKKPYRASKVLHDDLEQLFLEGESRDDKTGPKSKASKYSPEQALSVLSNMMDGQRRKYRQGGPNGSLPTCSYIKSWFSRRKNKGAIDIEKQSDKYEEMDKNALKNECSKIFGSQVLQPKGIMIQLLEVDDYMRYGGSDKGYSNLDTKVLKTECENRKLPTTVTVEAMKVLLRGYEKYNTTPAVIDDVIAMTLALEALEANRSE